MRGSGAEAARTHAWKMSASVQAYISSPSGNCRATRCALALRRRHTHLWTWRRRVSPREREGERATCSPQSCSLRAARRARGSAARPPGCRAAPAAVVRAGEGRGGRQPTCWCTTRRGCVGWAASALVSVAAGRASERRLPTKRRGGAAVSAGGSAGGSMLLVSSSAAQLSHSDGRRHHRAPDNARRAFRNRIARARDQWAK